jgi:hypothetical protein
MLMLVADDLDRLTLRRVRSWHRVLARWRATSLDRALADGAGPEQDVYLAARAMQLTSAKSRRHLADGLRQVLAGAERSRSGTGPARVPVWPTRVPVRRESVATAAADLAPLPGYLLAAGPVPAQGVAIVRRLLSDGAGPLYRESRHEELRDTAHRAAAALTR